MSPVPFVLYLLLLAGCFSPNRFIAIVCITLNALYIAVIVGWWLFGAWTGRIPSRFRV